MIPQYILTTSNVYYTRKAQALIWSLNIIKNFQFLGISILLYIIIKINPTRENSMRKENGIPAHTMLYSMSSIKSLYLVIFSYLFHLSSPHTMI